MRMMDIPKIPDELRKRGQGAKYDFHPTSTGGGQTIQNWRNANPPKTIGWSPSCPCDADEPIPCTVLDPFMGSGTMAVVAYRLGRQCIGIDLSEKYLTEIAIPRIEAARTGTDMREYRDRLELEAAGQQGLFEGAE